MQEAVSIKFLVTVLIDHFVVHSKTDILASPLGPNTTREPYAEWLAEKTCEPRNGLQKIVNAHQSTPSR